jgi:ParB family chromosome partitioning protein
MEQNLKTKNNTSRILGRGLDSLLPQSPERVKEGFDYIDIHKIESNPYQPRHSIPIASILEMSDSIKEKGVMVPITVIKSKDNNDGYVLVAGERRLQASKLAGLDKIPAVVREMTPQDMAESALIENIHRKDLNPLEEGYAFLRLNNEFKLTYEQIANKVSKNATYIENKIRLTKLPKLIQNSIAVGEITEQHGKVLLSLNDEEAMIAALKIIIRNSLNAKRAEELVRQIKSESLQTKRSLRPNPAIEWENKYKFIKEDINSGLGWNVNLKRNRKNGGALTINFNSDDELVSIYRKITGKEDSSYRIK